MINKATVMGRLGRDPEVRTFQSGDKVCNLSIATSESWRDKNSGEKREKTEWHRVSVFAQGLVRLCEQHLKKGARVYVEGKLETRKWQDQSGQDRFSTEIVLRPYDAKLQIIDWPQQEGDGAGGAGGYGSYGGAGGYGGAGRYGGTGGINDPAQQGPGGPARDYDDEIPF